MTDAEFGDLIRQHHARVLGVCAGLLGSEGADDAAQEVFLKAHRSLSSFEGKSSVSTWLYRIAVNHCLDVKRQQARRKESSLDALVDAGASLGEDPEAARARDAEAARELLAELPEQWREPLVLRAQGFSYEEIAETLECSVDSVKARLRRARAQVAATLSGAAKRPRR